MRVPFDCYLDVVKAYEEKGKWIVEGLAATTDFDLQEDVVSQEAIESSAKDLLENSTVLHNHNPNESMGKVLESRARKGALLLKILVSKTVPEIWQKIKEGVLNKFSIRGKILEATKKWIPALQKFARIILKMRLVEVSLVAVPANPKAKALRWYIEKALADYEEDGGEIEEEYEPTDTGGFEMADEVEVEEELLEAHGEPQVESGNQGGEVAKGFPAPETLWKEWTEFGKQKGLKDGDESWDAWVEFCKQQGYPHPYPYPYPKPEPQRGTRMREIAGIVDKLLAGEKDEARKKLLSQIKVIAEGASYTYPYPKPAGTAAKEQADAVAKAADAHLQLLSESVEAIQKLAQEIASASGSMDAAKLKAKLGQLSDLTYKLQQVAEVINASGSGAAAKSEVEKAGRKVSGDRLSRLKKLLDELQKFIAEVDTTVAAPGEKEKSAPGETDIIKKLQVVEETVEKLSKSLGSAEGKDGEQPGTLAETVKEITKRLDVLEDAPGERSSLDGQEDLADGKEKGKTLWKGLL
jgi:phage head maturation protease